MNYYLTELTTTDSTLPYSGSIEDAVKALKLLNHPANQTETPLPTPGTGGARPGTAQPPRDTIDKGLHDRYTSHDLKMFNGSMATDVFPQSGYTSFSGTDITVAAIFRGGLPVIIGECQTVSYSLFTPMQPVYALGTMKPSGYVKGPRTIAGSIIFTVFDRHALISAFHRSYSNYSGNPCLDKSYLPDELPPFDIQITFLNEYGQSAGITIFDVRITSEGQVQSIEDMITENTMQYMASDIRLMEPDFVQEPY